MLPISSEALLAVLRAAGEPSRLRILALLADGERSVKDLTDILGQSQPRISRHLKLLTDAGLVLRHPEGAWAFFRLADEGPAADVARDLLSRLDRGDAALARDRSRLEQVRRAHAEQAANYFRSQASQWDTVRSLHVQDDKIEGAVRRFVGEDKLGTVVDLGTGTGRMLEVMAERAVRGIGVDLSHDMLSYARSRLERAGLANCQVRHGDIYNLPIEDRVADAAVVHQVLHYLDEPERAVAEAARILKRGGRLIVVDFAPHGLEFLRADHAHRRLGFSDEQIAEWMAAAGVELADHVEFPPEASAGDAVDRLTVSVWLGRNVGKRKQQDRISGEAA